MNTKYLIISILFGIAGFTLIPDIAYGQDRAHQRHERRIGKQLENWTTVFPEWNHVGRVTLDSVSLNPGMKSLDLFFSPSLSYLPVREETVSLLHVSVRDHLSRKYCNLDLKIHTSGKVLEDLIPNSYRHTLNPDPARFRGLSDDRIPLVKNRNAFRYSGGLYYNNIAVWPSHGWYYESRQDRWKWQRPRLFSTVEDLLTRGFVLPYLVPMLENSGASVFLPVERDTQTRELIGDNDGSARGVRYRVPDNVMSVSQPQGFLLKDTLFPGDNPFAGGTSLRYAAIPGSDARVGVEADFEPGYYGVYVSWQTSENSSSQVVYEVVHAAGSDEFVANQRIGGGTWVYLGTFRFDRHNPDWSRRGLWDRQYSEAWRPNVPSMLLELLSHQNLADMRFGLDPRFRFSVSRSIYKGMLKYIAASEGRDYVVQPLPPDHFAIARNGEEELILSWRPVVDPLESSAKPNGYKIYQSIHDRGFVEIRSVADTFAIIGIRDRSAIHQYRITAYNSGGESFPTEVLSARLSGRKGTGLVVNGFDRVSGPTWFDNTIKAGIEWWNDEGVADKESYMYTGRQYNYDRAYPWMDDDNPGWGSSHSDREGLPEYGNRFDYTAMHGLDLFGANGYSWVSVSDEAFCRPEFDISPYFAVDILMGEELSTPSGPAGSEICFQIYTPEFMNKVTEIASQGGNILLSGAYVGTDLMLNEDSAALKFARDILRFTWRTNHASNIGKFEATHYGKPWFTSSGSFNQEYHPEIYTVEAPDGILPAGDSAFSALRYSGNLVGAAVAFNGNYRSFVMGFPVESITDAEERRALLREVIRFFEHHEVTGEPFLSPMAVQDNHGAVIRGDQAEKKVYLLFSGDEYADGAEHVLNVLGTMKVKGYFFLTGNFLRNPDFRGIVERIINDGHYLGPHSDKHLLYVPWEKRDSLLISHDGFIEDLTRNMEEIERFGVDPSAVNLFLAPYEWYNLQISEWSREAGLQLINFTPGTGTNADYTTPEMSNYRSSEELTERLWQFEKKDPAGLNGVILLIHPGTHPDRSDKFYHRLEGLIRELREKGYDL